METFLTAGSFVLSMIVAILIIPPIIRVSRAKKFFEPFDERKVNTEVTPPLGGIAIFLGFTLGTIIATDSYSFDSLKYVLASVIIMFFIGLKDDLMMVSARKKFVVQLFAAALLIIMGDIQITNLHGVLGINSISSFSSLFLTLFIMLAIINAFKLIDGIDGLASGLAIFASLMFGTWFYIVGHIQFAITAFALAGSLAGFFLFNVFGKKNKLFLGDTGSLIAGLIISTLVIKFNEYNIVKTIPHVIGAAPVVSFALISAPLIDTIRVMTIRISTNLSPFSPDKNHIHHRLLELFPNHFTVTLIIISANLVITLLSLWLNYIAFNINLQFTFVFIVAVLLSFIPSAVVRAKNKEGKKKTRILIEQLSQFL